jgi:metal-responsive CopG/Arc/MetJ family transcriptional regulator
MRVLVDIPQQQLDGLAILAQQHALARTELVRQAIAEYLQRHPPIMTPVMQQVFGMWKDNDAIDDGLAYQNTLRDEWQ